MTTIAPDLSAVLDLMVDSVTVQDASGRVVYANAVAARQLGFATTDELLASDPASWGERYTVYDEHGAPFPRYQLPGRLVLAGKDAPDVLLQYHDRATGEDRWAEAHASPLIAADGTRLAVNVVRDVTDRVRAETALREREARLRAVLTAMPDLMFVQAPDGTYLDFHADDDSRLFVLPPAFLGKRPGDVLPPEVVASVMPALEHTARTGELTAVEYALPVAGEEQHYEARLVRLDDNRVLSIVRDLTDRVRTEAALEERRRFVDHIAAASPAILYVYDNVTGRTVYVNEAVTRLLGYGPEAIRELVDPPFTPVLHPEDQARWPEMAAELAAAADGEIVEQAYRLRHANGQWCWVESRATVLTRTPDGGPHLVVAAALNVTAQREAEEALRESEERYRAVVEVQTELVDRYLPDTTLTFVNDAYCRYFGRTREELIGARFQEWLPSSARESAPEVISMIMASAEPVTSEHEVVRPDGSIGYVQWVDRAIRNANGEVVELQGVGRDVTELRRTEEALAASRRLADRVGAASPDILYVFDVLETRTVYVNDAVGRVLGYSPEQFTDTEPWTMRHPDDRETLLAAVAQIAAAEDGEVVESAFRMRHADGGWRWLAARVTVLSREPDGRPRLVVGAASDVTVLRETEAALRESEARYREVVDLQTELVARFLPDTTLTFVNDAYCRFFDRAKDELIGMRFLELDPPWTRETTLARVATIGGSSEPVTVEHEEYLPDGSLGWVQWNNRAIRDADGNVVELQVVGRDVTELRRAEEALRASETRYRAVVDSQIDIVCRYLPDTTLTFVNDAYCRFFGRTREELIGLSYFELIPPSTHNDVRGLIELIVSSLEPVTSEHEMFMPDGSIGYMQWIDRAIRDANGKVVEIQAVGRDVTELRRAEEALRTSETQLRLALENAAMGTWDWNVEADWIAWSEGSGPLCGLPAGTPGVTTEEFYARVHPDDRARLRTEAERRVADAADYAVEFRVAWSDGTNRWLERKGKAVARDAAGRATRFLGVTADITARKQTEATLRRLSHQLLKLQDDERRRLARELHDGVAQDVFAITVALDTVDKEASRLNSRSRGALADAQQLAEEVLRVLRTRAYLLHPPLLDMVGLAPALREYAVGLSRRGEFEVDTSGVEAIGRLPAEVETALFRVAQEALSNVAKHAATDRATLALRCAGGMVELRVADQGKGRLADERPLGTVSIGVGIPGMRERLRQIGGELEIASGPGWTTVTARSPVAQHAL